MVITTMDRAHLLALSLDHMAALTPPDELIIVDDGGSDNTREVVQEFADREVCVTRYLYNHNPGKSLCSLARNIGARYATHEWIITTEPELIFLTDLVRQFKELHEQHPTKVISTGKVYFQPEALAGQGIDEGSWASWQVADAWVAPHAALWGRNWLYAVGGWDEEFPGTWGWDDTDLLTRLRLAGYGQYIAREVEAVHLFHGLGSDPDSANERYFQAKSFMRDETDTTDLIANRGIEWGALRTTSS
jgi:glycosyltransferase involved in cell wall biosynthesis